MDHRILELEDVLEGPVQPSHFTDEAQRGGYFNQDHTAKLESSWGLQPSSWCLPLCFSWWDAASWVPEPWGSASDLSAHTHLSRIKRQSQIPRFRSGRCTSFQKYGLCSGLGPEPGRWNTEKSKGQFLPGHMYPRSQKKKMFSGPQESRNTKTRKQ